MLPPVYPRGLEGRTDIAIGGGDEPEKQYLYRPGELVVHTDDRGLVETELLEARYRAADRVGSYELFVGGPAEPTELTELLSNLRTPRRLLASDEPRVPNLARHHVFFPCPGRVGAASHAVATDLSFPPNHAPVTDDLLVGVVDTGIVEQDGKPHPWFAGHVRYEPADVDPLDDSFGQLSEYDAHGTFVAGLILREAPRATVVMKGISDDGFITEFAIADAIRQLGADPKIELINLSISGYTEEQAEPSPIREALQSLDERVVVVIAAGNDGSSELTYPAAISREGVAARLITVGAGDETRSMPIGASPPRAEYSNYGSWVDAYANGEQVLGPYCEFTETGADLDRNRPAQRFTGYARWSGTSYATPTVAGRIAAVKLDNPDLTMRQAAALVLRESTIYLGVEQGQKPYVRGVTSTWPPISPPDSFDRG